MRAVGNYGNGQDAPKARESETEPPPLCWAEKDHARMPEARRMLPQQQRQLQPGVHTHL